MTQFEHNLLGMALLFLTAFIFRDYFFYTSECEYWQKKFNKWLQ